MKMQENIQPNRGRMDNLSDKYISIVNRPGPFSAVLLTVLGIVSWPIRFFKLSVEDRLKAGLYLGYEDVTDKPDRTHSLPS